VAAGAGSVSRAATDCGAPWVHMCTNCVPTATSSVRRGDLPNLFFIGSFSSGSWAMQHARGLVQVDETADYSLGTCIYISCIRRMRGAVVN
jgi:hypothetical protein